MTPYQIDVYAKFKDSWILTRTIEAITPVPNSYTDRCKILTAGGHSIQVEMSVHQAMNRITEATNQAKPPS